MTRTALIPSSLAVPAASGRTTGRIFRWLGKLWPGEAIRDRILERVYRRRGPQALPFTLAYRNIFVLPTWFGTGFAIRELASQCDVRSVSPSGPMKTFVGASL